MTQWIARNQSTAFIVNDQNEIIAECRDQSTASQIAHEHNTWEELVEALEASINWLSWTAPAAYRLADTALAHARKDK